MHLLFYINELNFMCQNYIALFLVELTCIVHVRNYRYNLLYLLTRCPLVEDQWFPDPRRLDSTRLTFVVTIKLKCLCLLMYGQCYKLEGNNINFSTVVISFVSCYRKSLIYRFKLFAGKATTSSIALTTSSNILLLSKSVLEQMAHLDELCCNAVCLPMHLS